MSGLVVPGEGWTIERVISQSIHSLGEVFAPKKGQQMLVSGLQTKLVLPLEHQFCLYFML